MPQVPLCISTDEGHREDSGNESESSASSCGSTHLKAMVPFEEPSTSVFGCRLAGPDEFQIAKKTVKPKKIRSTHNATFSNKYAALDDETPQVVTALSTWATKVSVRKAVRREPRRAEKTCLNEADLDDYLRSHPTIVAALPEEPKAIAKLAKRKPGDHELSEGEQWFMVDSGAGTNGAKCAKFFKNYKIQDYPANRPGPRCVAANGAPLENGGYVNLNVTIAGEEHVLPMDDLPLEMPILSVRKIVRKGNYVTFRDGGGYIKNVKSGKRLHFVERQGVYFIKVKVNDPSPNKAVEGFKPMAGFSRPGR